MFPVCIPRISASIVFCLASLVIPVGTASAQSAQQRAPLPGDVHALVYSTTAAELFFTPAADYRTRITHNGLDRGTTDARSLWLDGLDPTISHRFELRSVLPVGDGGSQPSFSVLTLFTGDFSPPVYRVDAENTVLELIDAPPINADLDNSVLNDAAQSDAAFGAAAIIDEVPPADLFVEIDVDVEPAAVVSPPAQVSEIDSACNVNSINDLVRCANEASNYDVINVRTDLTCSNGNCCPSGNALINLRSVNQLSILGNGKRLLREDGQRRCSLLDVVGGNSITVKDWVLDDDVNTQGCQVGDNCPRMIHVRGANNVAFNNVTVQNGKGYTIYIDEVNGFQFVNSRLINSGVLGLYIGHGDRASTNVLVENSTFIDNQTNALALLGVTGSNAGVNRVVNNRFLRNHRRGQWQVAPQYGTGFTNGGQVYIAQASGVTFENNVIRDGYCDNCLVQTRARSAVTGLEIGIPGRATVSSMLINNNHIENHDGFGIHSNVNSSIPGTVQVQNNQLLTNYVGISLQGGQASGNTVKDTRWFQSFEGGNDLDAQFVVESACAGAAVRRVCGTPDARHGACVAEVTTANSCAASPVRLTTRPQSVSAGQRIQAAAWVKGTASDWCLVFSNNGNFVDEHCTSLQAATPSNVGNALGTPALSAQVPGGANQVAAQLRVSQAGVRVVIDDVKLSGY